jgi:hypothetical protein
MHCPNCGAANSVTVKPALTAKQLGAFSLAGNQMKVSASVIARAECSECDLSVTGYLKDATYAEDGKTFTGGDFVVDRADLT